MPRYDDSHVPPAPIVDVIVRHPADGIRTAALRGKLDTGADLSAIPDSLAIAFQFPGRGTVTTRDYKGEITTHVAHSVSLEIEGWRKDLPGFQKPGRSFLCLT